MNQVYIVGNLGQDPTFGSTNSGAEYVKFSIAHNESYTSNGMQQEKTHWFNVTGWRGVVETMRGVCKGERVMVSGKLVYNKFVGSDGVQRTSVEITAFTVLPTPRPVKRQESAPVEEPVHLEEPTFEEKKPTPKRGKKATVPPTQEDDDEIRF